MTNQEESKPGLLKRTIARITDRRKSLRLVGEVTVRYGPAGEMTAGRGYDLSESGIGLTGCKPFPLGTKLDLEFCIDSAQAECFRARGIVLYSKPDRMGVEFVEISAESRNQIRTAIRHELAIRRRES